MPVASVRIHDPHQAAAWAGATDNAQAPSGAAKFFTNNIQVSLSHGIQSTFELFSLASQAIVHLGLHHMALMTQRSKILNAVVTAICQGSHVVDFQVIGTGADYAAMSVPGKHCFTGGV